jgi:hypothetical protein
MTNYELTAAGLVTKCIGIVGCDTGRISKPSDKMFFIAGYNKNTRDDEGQWVKNGACIDFDYIAETVVAHGKTEDELVASCEEYKRLCDMTWEEYFQEVKNA